MILAVSEKRCLENEFQSDIFRYVIPGQEPYFLLRYMIMLWIGSRRCIIYADNVNQLNCQVTRALDSFNFDRRFEFYTLVLLQ